MIKEQILKKKAKEASKRAYCPYSNFQVGASVITEKGEIFSGCNVENASYGLTICAERNAIFQAVSAGARNISGIVIYTSMGKPSMPCGACRQVIYEFGSKIEILSFTSKIEIRNSIDNLLPEAFGIQDLDKQAV